jgi:hypothetical protein
VARRKKTDEQAEILFDFDGYFGFLMERTVATPRSAVAHLDAWADPQRLSLLHFMLRSTMVLPFSAGPDGADALTQWSRLCLDYAVDYGEELASSPLAAPRWAADFDQDIKTALRETHPHAEQVRVVTSLEPRLNARSFPDRMTVEVSALTREYLRNLNILLWSVVFGVSEGKIPATEVDEIPVLEHLLAYILSSYSDVNYSGLPIPRVYDQRALACALRTTQIQLQFMFAHEYAHLLIQDGRVGPEAETAADVFAYDLLFTHLPDLEPGDIWTALRWLFRLLSLDRITGELLYGGPVDWDQADVLAREHLMLDHIKESGISRADNALEITGTYLILKAKADLHRAEDGWLPDFARRYRAQHSLSRLGGPR